jgi:hypothetical protein
VGQRPLRIFQGTSLSPERHRRQTCGVAVATAAGHHIGVPKGAKAQVVMLLTIFKIQAHGAKIRCLVYKNSLLGLIDAPLVS